LSEVAPERFADEDRELLPEGLVEAVGLRQVLLRLGGERVGALGDGIERAARRGVHDEESHQRHGENRRDQPEESLNRVGEHRVSLVTCRPDATWGSSGAVTIGKALREVKREVVSSVV
jgi:hypothetical protein